MGRSRFHAWLLAVAALGCAAACASAPPAEPQSARLLEEADRLFDSRQRGGAMSAYQFAMVAAHGEDDDARWVEATAQIAHLHVLAGDLAAAAEWLERSRTRLAPGAAAARARWLLARGALERARGEALAAETFAEAYAIARDARLWERAVQAAYMATLASGGDASVAWAERALEVAALAREPEWAGELELVLARELEASGRFGEAHARYRDAHDHLAARRDVARAFVSSLGAARCLRHDGRRGEARDALEPLVRELQSAFARGGSQWSAEILVRARLEQAELDLAGGAQARASGRLADARALVRRAGLARAAPELAAEVELRAKRLGVADAAEDAFPAPAAEPSPRAVER